MKSPITTHVLDTARGGPASNVDVRLERETVQGFEILATGVYRLTFDVASYLEARGERGFYPSESRIWPATTPRRSRGGGRGWPLGRDRS